MKKLIAISVLAALAVSNGVQAAGDIEAGKAKAATCAACHGMDGNSLQPIWPNLAGQHPGYIAKQLKAFKSGERKDPTMTAMAAPLNDADVENLAAYFSTLSTKTGETDPAMLELGQQIFRGGNLESGVAACMACHGPNGAGNPAASFPALAGQKAEYTKKQLNAFKNGERTNDPAKMMRDVAGKMTTQEIDAVASYIQGLH